jgi:SulP family sulfate permease
MSEWREFIRLFKSPKSDMAILLVTFFITVLVDLVKAIEIGMMLAAFLFMKRMSDVSNVDVATLDASEGDTVSLVENEKLKALPRIQVYDINGPFFFGAADKFLNALSEIHDDTDKLLVRMHNVPSMDATALHAFNRMVHICERHHIKIMVCGVNAQPERVMKNDGVYDAIGQNQFFKSDQDAIDFLYNKYAMNQPLHQAH